MELFPGQMEHEPHQEAKIEDGTQAAEWHWRCLRLYWTLPRDKVEFHIFSGALVANGLMLVAREQWKANWRDKSSIKKNKTAGCFLQRRRIFRSGCHMDDGPQASPCPSTSKHLLTVSVSSCQCTDWREEFNSQKPSLGSFTCWKGLLYAGSICRRGGILQRHF